MIRNFKYVQKQQKLQKHLEITKIFSQCAVNRVSLNIINAKIISGTKSLKTNQRVFRKL